jgi:hypothetical protein
MKFIQDGAHRHTERRDSKPCRDHPALPLRVAPGLATTGGPLILASSPHARRGVLWEVFKRHHGAGGDPLILVAHGASRTLNPSLPQRVVDRALEKDRTRAMAEYLAEFRTDVEGFVALEVVEG